jgi:hypothetical protein
VCSEHAAKQCSLKATQQRPQSLRSWLGCGLLLDHIEIDFDGFAVTVGKIRLAKRTPPNSEGRMVADGI